LSPPEPPGVFHEPWQAQAFALTLHLHDAGVFTWDQWTRALAEALTFRAAPDGSDYYEAWLRALESLAVDLGLAERGALESLKAAWADAYKHTPHGRPVALASPGAPRSL
jgi:nitrile hydratase accessory protein